MTTRTNDVTDEEAVAQSSDGCLLLEIADGIATVTLNRPAKLNAINRAMIRGLQVAVEATSARTEVRVLVVRGAGRMFSAGGDLDEVSELVRDKPAFDAFLDDWHSAFSALDASGKPVLGVVHGLAMAGGLELLHVCDFVVATDTARFGDQHAHYGLFPAGGSTQRLIRLIGPRRAAWMLVSGEAIDAQTALDYGLINRVVGEGDLDAAASEMARLLRDLSPNATAAIKQALRVGDGLPVDAALRAERETAVDHMASDDVQIGMAAFRGRTKPVF